MYYKRVSVYDGVSPNDNAESISTHVTQNEYMPVPGDIINGAWFNSPCLLIVCVKWKNKRSSDMLILTVMDVSTRMLRTFTERKRFFRVITKTHTRTA